MNTRFAIAIVPVRAAPALAAALNITVAFPLPVAPDVTVIHGTALLADQAHPGGDVTAIGDPAPPAAPMFWDVGAMDTLQLGVGAAAP